MKTVCRFAAMMMVLVFFLTGCTKASGPSDPLSQLNISDDLYAQYFSPVESAVLYVDGVPQQISANDSRLLCVLNFLAYAAETKQFSRTQGVVKEEQIERYFSSNATMLEVTFTAVTENSSRFRNTPKILVSGDTFLLFMNPETYYTQEPCAERHWPYQNLAPDGARKSSDALDWGGEYWLDILKHCGF